MECDILVEEQKRVTIQNTLDGGKTQAERNKLGQFATPTELAREMLQYARQLLPSGTSIKFLDPAIGTGSFYSALQYAFLKEDIISAKGYEIDPDYGEQAQKLWANHNIDILIGDFTKHEPDEDCKNNLLIANPPYVRHHHVDPGEKKRLQELVFKRIGIKVSGLSGLYCYFLLLCHTWMEENGVAGWLIPTEFMDVNYGKQIRKYLLNNVTLLHVHRFDSNDVQFGDALVSSALVWFRNIPPPKDHMVIFSFGGPLNNPKNSQVVTAKVLGQISKWNPQALSLSSSTNPKIRLADLFQVKRGLATGANNFFILNRQQLKEYKIPDQFVRPILPSPRYLPITEVFTDEQGVPVLTEQLFLFSSKEPEEVLQIQFPAVWEYLKKGIDQGVHLTYLCSHRSPWYSQENRKQTPFLCTYMGRGENGRPFRFILNHSQATAANVYLMLYPKEWLQKIFEQEPRYIRLVWEKLNELTVTDLISEGRLYGGGLHKMEPKDLGNVSAEKIVEALPQEKRNMVCI